MAIDKTIVFTLCAALVVIALGGCGEERPADRDRPAQKVDEATQVSKKVEEATERIGNGVEGKGDPEAGKKAYTVFCASCHGKMGKGDGPAAAALPTKPRSLADGAYMNTLSDQHLFKVIKEGGASVGKSPLMPAFVSQLDDRQIRNVVAHVRTLSKSSN